MFIGLQKLDNRGVWMISKRRVIRILLEEGPPEEEGP